MANPDHVKMLDEGLEVWNAWREENPDIRPDLEYADLRGKNLQQYNLSEANLDNAQIMRCELNAANLSNSSLRNAVGSHVTFNKANLTKADASGINISNSQMNNATLHDSIFKNANLSSSNLSLIKATGVSFNQANLQKVNFTGADLNNSIFDGSNLTSANLSEAKLINSSFVGVNAQNSNFHHADMAGSKVDNANFEATHFALADLRRVDFRKAKIDRCMFNKAIADAHNFLDDQLTEQNKIDLDFEVQDDNSQKAEEQPPSRIDLIDFGEKNGPETSTSNNRSSIPSEEEIKQLPRWARVAFAARCARRVQPLFTILRPDASPEYIEAIKIAIAIAEVSAMTAAKDIKTSDAVAAYEAANKAKVSTAAYAAGSVYAAQISYIEATITSAISDAHTFGIANIVKVEIRRDFDQLLKLAKEKNWNNDTPVGWEVFGPMWPEGEPDWEEIAARVQEEPKQPATKKTAKKKVTKKKPEPVKDELGKGEGIPSEEEIKQLPRWAQVAFAARCARRVQPLFSAFWPDAPMKHIEAIEKAISMTEKIVATGDIATIGDGTIAANTVDAAVAAGADIAGARYVALASAAVAVGNPTDAFIHVARAVNEIERNEPQFQIIAGFRWDMDYLTKMAKESNWDDESSVPSVGSTLFWPEGEPDWEKIVAQIENTGKKRNESESEISSNEELRRVFERFLVNNKGYPQEVLVAVPYLGGDEYRPNCVTEVMGNDEEILALITFRIAMDENDSAFQDMFVYEEAINMSDVPKYIVYADKSSNHPFAIYEYEEAGETNQVLIEDFPTFIEMLFLSPLSGAGRRLYSSVIELAKNKCDLKLDATCKDYINLKKNNRVAAQVHRLNDSEKNVALVLAGYQSVFPEPINEAYVFTGELSQLSGNIKEHPKEIAWLNGNVNHERLRFRAGVYVLLSGSLVFPEVEEEVGRLIDLAAKNAGDDNSKNETETKRANGTIPTISPDTASKEDLLGRKLLAQSLAKMFTHTKDIEGLTVALLGDWGEGKSTVMNLVEKELEKELFEFAKFNAWEYEHTDNIAAGLAQEVLKGLLNFKGKSAYRNHLWIRVRFACKTHPWGIVGLCCCVILAALGTLLLFWKRDLFWFGITSVTFFPLLLKIYSVYKRTQSHSLAVQMLKYLKLPEYHKHLGLIPALKKDIQILCDLRLKKEKKKLLVFVDDLDRCQSECISKTLDAIRLVMSIPNVIVMIGIDHRIAFKAIEKTYEELGDDDGRNQADIARDYLGKIILLPVRLMSTEKTELKEYIDKKLYPDAEEVAPEQKTASVKTAVPKSIPTFHDEDENFDNVAPEVPLMGGSDFSETHPSSSQPTEEETEEQIEEAMRETTEERDRFYKLAVQFKFTNPRQLLRLRNCYRLLKALNSQKGYQIEDLLTMIFWQEFLHAQRHEARNRCMASLSDKKFVEEIKDRDVKQILNDLRDEIAGLFQSDGKYASIAQFVRCVVLPHSEEGVFDTSAEIEEWIQRQDGNLHSSGKKTACPLGLKIG